MEMTREKWEGKRPKAKKGWRDQKKIKERGSKIINK